MTLRLNLVNLTWEQVSGSSSYDILLDGTKVAQAGPRARSTKINIPEGAEHKVTIKAQPSGRVQEAKFEWASLIPTPPPPPPPSGDPIPANGIITAGGTYTGSRTGLLTIQTAQPVTLSYASLTGAGGYRMIAAPSSVGGTPITLTLDHCTITGSTAKERIMTLDTNWASIVATNCSIVGTAGFKFVAGLAGSVITLLRNRHTNIQRNSVDGVGNFVQFSNVQSSIIELGWNEILNEYDLSDPEDLVSVYHSSNVYMHDNMFWHQSRPGNTGGSSQSGITLDCSTAGLAVSNNRVEYNQIVDGYGIFFALSNGGSNNIMLGNRIIADGLLPNGTTKAYGYQGTHITSGGSNNHAHSNLIGYISGSVSGSARRDGAFEGCPEGDAGEWANNTHLGHDPTNADEQAEWTYWQSKLATNAVTIGA